MNRWGENRTGTNVRNAVVVAVVLGFFSTMLGACGDENLVVPGKPLPTPPPATSTPDDGGDEDDT